MIIHNWSLEKVMQGIEEELPWGSWCINLDNDTITCYGKLLDFVELQQPESTIAGFCKHIREDFRDSVVIAMREVHRLRALDISFATNKYWINLRLTHFDEDNNKAYGYATKIEPMMSKKDEQLQDLIIKQTRFLNMVLNDISLYTIEDATDKILADVLNEIEADRISIIQYDYDKQTQSCTHNVSKTGIESRTKTFNGVPISVTPIINKTMLSDQLFNIYDMTQLSETEVIETNIVGCNKNKSVVLLPLKRKGQTLGYLIVDFIHNYKNMSEIELDWIKIANHIVEASLLMSIRMVRDIENNKQYSKLLDILPFGYLHVKLKFNSEGQADDITIINANQKFEYYIGKSGIMGKSGNIVFGKEKRHILTTCIEVTQKGYHLTVDDFLYINGRALCADISMTNFNEFVCIVSHSAKALHETLNISHRSLYNENVNSLEQNGLELVYSVKSHLNTIIDLCQMHNKDDNNENKKKYVDMIKESTQRLLNSDILPDNQSLNKIEKTMETTSERSARNEDRHKILIAEDTESNYMLLTYILKDSYTLLWAHDGIEAIEMYEQEKPDLILMDVRMPRMSGLSATMRIRETDKKIPIVALTAFAFESDKAKTLEAGCTDFIPKPIKAASLKDLVRRYLK